MFERDRDNPVYGGLAEQAIDTAKGIGPMNRNPPVRKIVEMQIKEFEEQIKQRREFLEALDANPGTEDVLDKMRKLHL